MVAYFFSPTHPEMTQANGICSGFHYGIFPQISTIEQVRFVFKHYLYCKDAENYKNQQVVFQDCSYTLRGA